MRLSTSLALAALGLAASALPAAAGTLLVPSKAYPTIQSALNAAKPYDTVLVSPKNGGAAYGEAVIISTPHVTLQGQNSPVIDGSKLGVIVPQALPFTPYPAFPNGVEVKADHVAVRGMTIQGFGFGDGAISPIAAAINVGFSVVTGPYSRSEVSYSDIEISGNTLQKNSTGLTIQGYTGGYSQTTYLKGYRVLGNLISGNTGGGALLSGASVLVAGNRIIGNQSNGQTGDGLDVTGLGITVTGNEVGGSGGSGIDIIEDAATYNPAVNDRKNPNPDPAVTALNYIHDNGGSGIEAQGTQTLSGNVIANSAGEGIDLEYADYSAVSGNAITGSLGDGIFAGYDSSFSENQESGLNISFNQVSGSGYDGIAFYEVAGGVISYNNVTGSQGIGIHLSDYTSDYGYDDYAPTTVTQNHALHNVLFDAGDDASAPDVDASTTINIWTKNVFGTTDPAGLSK